MYNGLNIISRFMLGALCACINTISGPVLRVVSKSDSVSIFFPRPYILHKDRYLNIYFIYTLYTLYRYQTWKIYGLHRNIETTNFKAGTSESILGF